MKYAVWALAAIALGAPSLASAQAAKGNAAAGQAVFKMQCGLCHATVAGKNGVGPSLAGFAVRKPASAPGFAYSAAMKARTAKWDAPALDAYITAPSKALPGTKMIFVGQKDAKKRADLIAYLFTLK